MERDNSDKNTNVPGQQGPEPMYIAKVQNVNTGEISFILPGTPAADEMFKSMEKQPGEFD